MTASNKITITKPDDWHLHVRDNEYLAGVLPHTADRFQRAIMMPNLAEPVTTVDMAESYRDRIIDALPAIYKLTFDPLMTLYLTNRTKVSEIKKARDAGFVHAVKWYPAGATTNSSKGVSDIVACYDVLEAMAEEGMPLLVHGEVTDPHVDVFDRERIFIEQFLEGIIKNFPDLKVVFEHITTKYAVELVEKSSANVGATITAHHMLLNRNAMFQGGIKPHNYCLPILKREEHREALVKAATSGNKKFFLGTDSAPHTRNAKENACGCAGIYTAHGGIELYAEIFDKADALAKLEGFASHHGPDFYGLPRNREKITLTRKKVAIPESFPFGNEEVVPFRAGGELLWSID
ncbi:dihydroorotase [Pseudemcibacter aquimaris]|uniref:dihydroorotase n=1 Tax=Pseudemcibacter aquimaris TaxID=2857064 RepID=UPI002012467A|nr:dihydroorotase [Pseudemcibacter aquimaris]MCC3861704.1 dihydroorotase [Pseudemcibacter aquimaris]WDU58474.1 dihydroorotase [Pseudemcibacter aquimaris]